MIPGWEDMDNLGPAAVAEVQRLKGLQAESDELDRVFAMTFGTGAGKKVIEYLRSVTIDQPSWVPGQPADHGYMREGQNEIVRQIIKRTERGKRGA